MHLIIKTIVIPLSLYYLIFNPCGYTYDIQNNDLYQAPSFGVDNIKSPQRTYKTKTIAVANPFFYYEEDSYEMVSGYNIMFKVLPAHIHYDENGIVYDAITCDVKLENSEYISRQEIQVEYFNNNPRFFSIVSDVIIYTRGR